MNPSTANWLEKAGEDLAVLQAIPIEANLTSGIAFHAQQCVEKSLKAVLCEKAQNIPRSHDLVFLYNRVRNLEPNWRLDGSILIELSTLYIESRYPGAFGMLPSGRPTVSDAQRFRFFAERVLQETDRFIDRGKAG